MLEVGSGSGYQAAVLAACVRKVYTIEIVAPLAERARVALDAIAARAGANDVVVLTHAEYVVILEGAAGARFLTERTSTSSASKWLSQNGWTVVTSELGYVAKQFPTLTDEQRAEAGDETEERPAANDESASGAAADEDDASATEGDGEEAAAEGSDDGVEEEGASDNAADASDESADEESATPAPGE